MDSKSGRKADKDLDYKVDCIMLISLGNQVESGTGWRVV